MCVASIAAAASRWGRARATSNAKTCAAPWMPLATSLSPKTAKFHVLPHEFIVDSQDSIRDPIGMVGQRLVANVYVVTSSIAASQNLVTAANKAGILVSDTMLEPLASAEACLTQYVRDFGFCFLYIGGGITEVLVYGVCCV